MLVPESTCIICGEEATVMREISLARNTWDLLKPLEPNADTINVERHLSTQFQLSSPRMETRIPFNPNYGNACSESRRPAMGTDSNYPPVRLPFMNSNSPEKSPSIPTTVFMGASSPGLYQRQHTPQTDTCTSDEMTSNDSATNFDTPGSSDLPQQSHPAKASTPLSPKPIIAQGNNQPELMWQSSSTVSSDPGRAGRSRTLSSTAPAEKGMSKWRSKLTSSKKEIAKSSGDSSTVSSTTLESQKLEEISLKNLSSSSKTSRGKSGKNINVAISQNSAYVLFWSHASIQIWDVCSSSPILGRAILTESNCVLAAVTKVHLVYIIGTRDQKLTVSARSSRIDLSLTD